MGSNIRRVRSVTVFAVVVALFCAFSTRAAFGDEALNQIQAEPAETVAVASSPTDASALVGSGREAE